MTTKPTRGATHENRVERLAKIRTLVTHGVCDPYTIANVIQCAVTTVRHDLELLREDMISDVVLDEGIASYAQQIRRREESLARNKEIEAQLQDLALQNPGNPDITAQLVAVGQLVQRAYDGLEKLRGLCVDRVEVWLKGRQGPTPVDAVSVPAEPDLSDDVRRQILLLMAPAPPYNPDDDTDE